MTKDEVLWFMSEPGAFLNLERYGAVAGRYCKLDLQKGGFTLTERVSTVKKETIEFLKVVIFSLALLCIITGIWYLIISNAQTERTVYLITGIWVMYFLGLCWGVSLLLSTLSRAKSLVANQVKVSSYPDSIS